MDWHDNKIFNDPEFLESLRTKLEKGATASFVVHIDDDMDTAKQTLENCCPGLIELKHGFPKQLSIRWSPIKPNQHYTVVDGEKVILEEPHHRDDKQPWMYISDISPKLGEEWKRRFDEFSEYCIELAF